MLLHEYAYGGQSSNQSNLQNRKKKKQYIESKSNILALGPSQTPSSNTSIPPSLDLILDGCSPSPLKHLLSFLRSGKELSNYMELLIRALEVNSPKNKYPSTTCGAQKSYRVTYPSV